MSQEIIMTKKNSLFTLALALLLIASVSMWAHTVTPVTGTMTDTN